MKLEISVAGSSSSDAPVLALLHGWGMHCGVFADLIARLAASHRLLLIDLPGHGLNHQLTRIPPLPQLADAIIESLPQCCAARPFTCLGWSLGGQLAMTLALRYRQRVSRLALVATTPRFVRSEDWPYGMQKQVFADFAADLADDHDGTWRRFLALEVHGTATARQDLRRLRSVATAWPEPATSALADGLTLLADNDLRPQVKHISQPTLLISGGRDRLVPPAAGMWLAEQIPAAEFKLLPGSGHAPFLGDSATFNDLLAEFSAAEMAGASHV